MVELSITVYSSLMIVMMFCAVLYERSYANTSLKQRSEYSSYKYLLLSSILFAIIFGVRFDVGWDYMSYLNYYVSEEGGAKFEFLFTSITKILRFFNLNFIFYFATFAFIQIFFFLLAYRKEPNIQKYLAYFLFTDAFFLFWMNGIRQGCASSIWLFSLQYVNERSFKKYLSVCIIAMMFHSSAVFLILLYPVLVKFEKRIEVSIGVQITLYVLTFIFQSFFIQYFEQATSLVSSISSVTGGRYEEYTGRIQLGDDLNSGIGPSDLLRICGCLLAIIYSKRMYHYYNNKVFTLSYNIFFWGTLLLNIVPHGSIFHRMFIYFEVFRPIMYAFLCSYLFKTKKSIIGIILLLGFAGLFVMRQIVAKDDDHSLYQFVFSQISQI